MTDQLNAASVPPDLQAKLNAATSVDELRELIMSMVASRELTPAELIPSIAFDKRIQTILQLRKEVAEKQYIAEGTKITLTEAAEKYDVGESSIRRWTKQQLLDGSPVVLIYEKGFGRGQKVIVDENHVAAMALFGRKFRPEGRSNGPIKGFYKYGPRKKSA